MDFPSSPAIGQTYLLGNRLWQWDGAGWQRVVNANQAVAVFAEIGPLVQTSAAALPAIGNDWYLVNYV